jgi:hypothetical protein
VLRVAAAADATKAESSRLARLAQQLHFKQARQAMSEEVLKRQ